MDKLEAALKNLDIDYSEETIIKYQKYMDGILNWNEHINLTAITDRDEFVSKHYIDSLVCSGLEEFRASRKVLDLGTGAGFPGVPLAIANPDKKFILMDSLLKRLKIIDQLTKEIGIFNTETVHGRAEELARNKMYRESFDVCISRAVANLATLAEYCLPFVKEGGYFLAYKGPVANEELEKASKAIKVLGGEVERIEPAEFDGYKHNIVVVKKIAKTGKKYPRKAGMPSKEPIM